MINSGHKSNGVSALHNNWCESQLDTISFFAICGEKSHCIVYLQSHYIKENTGDNTGFI